RWPPPSATPVPAAPVSRGGMLMIQFSKPRAELVPPLLVISPHVTQAHVSGPVLFCELLQAIQRCVEGTKPRPRFLVQLGSIAGHTQEAHQGREPHTLAAQAGNNA